LENFKQHCLIKTTIARGSPTMRQTCLKKYKLDILDTKKKEREIAAFDFFWISCTNLHLIHFTGVKSGGVNDKLQHGLTMRETPHGVP
jgi:hypothetical protein